MARLQTRTPGKTQKPSICLVCWDAEAAAAHGKQLTKAGFRVTIVDRAMKGWISYFRDLALDAVVIDLNRLPSHGREIGILLRGSKSTRHLPLVFLGGVEEKVARVQAELPDAAFARWEDAPHTIFAAISRPIHRPVRPVQIMERNQGAALNRKLGIKEAVPTLLWGDADFLQDLLGNSPQTVRRLQARHAGQPHLCLCVTRSAADVEAAFDAAAYCPVGSSVWILHPKQTSRLRTDYNQNDVRIIGLVRGWVDFKVCAVDADWSGLQFTRRKPGQPGHGMK